MKVKFNFRSLKLKVHSHNTRLSVISFGFGEKGVRSKE
jgi:hypothetical protein